MKLYLLICPLLLTGYSYAEVKMTPNNNRNPVTYTLANSCLKAEIIPAASGSITALRSAFADRELFRPFEYSKERFDLLPDAIAVSPYGSRTFFWGGKALFNQSVQISSSGTGTEAAWLETSANYFSGSEFRMTRRIILPLGKAKLKFQISVVNLSGQPQPIRLWEHLLANPGEKCRVFMPAAAQSTSFDRQTTTQLDREQLFIDDERNTQYNTFLTPADNWIAISGGTPPITLVLRGEHRKIIPGGVLYSQKIINAGLHTVELLEAPVILPSGGSHHAEHELLVLAGLPGITTLHDDLGAEFLVSGKELRATFATAAPLKPRNWHILAGHQVIATISLPQMKPGQLVQKIILMPTPFRADQLRLKPQI